MQLSLNQWGSAINQQIQVEPSVEVVVNTEFIASSRELQVEVVIVGKEPITNSDLRLSVMLTESGIIDAQDDFEAGGIVDDYEHNHVLRDMLTPAAGLTIGSSITVGEIITQTFTTTLPDNWMHHNMEVIAFVSRVEGGTYPVLQAASAHVVE